jgi:hypothetical protein
MLTDFSHCGFCLIRVGASNYVVPVEKFLIHSLCCGRTSRRICIDVVIYKEWEVLCLKQLPLTYGLYHT